MNSNRMNILNGRWEYTDNLPEVFGKNRKKRHKNTKNAIKSQSYI